MLFLIPLGALVWMMSARRIRKISFGVRDYRGELGWKLSRFARVVVDVAARKARLWLSGREDIYTAAFCLARAVSRTSWVLKSEQVLARWDLPDHCDWEGGAAPLKPICISSKVKCAVNLWNVGSVMSLLMVGPLFTWILRKRHLLGRACW